MHESVVQNQIPVVLLEGTGGCCDLFAKCYQLFNEYHSKIKSNVSLIYSEDEKKSKLREKLPIIDNKINTGSTVNLSDVNDEIDYFELIYECIEKRNLFLNFIDLKVHNHIEPDIDLAILQALLNGNETHLNS